MTLNIQVSPKIETTDQRIAALAERMSQRARENSHHGDLYSWDQATDYVDSRGDIIRNDPLTTPQRLNKQIRSGPNYCGPGSSFMSHAWRLHETWPEVFVSDTKILVYQSYVRIANSRVGDKNALRQWAEDTQPSQQELRDRIRELTGDDVLRRGFRLQTTNHWKFSSSDGFDPSDFDGGISRDVMANLLHYLTHPGDLVVDPMAGSGRLAKVTTELPYFKSDWQDIDDCDNGGPRTVLMSDLAPTGGDIIEADASKLIPFKDAHMVLLDPPYWRIAQGKYSHGPDEFQAWLVFLTAILKNCHATLRTGGHLALILDDYLRSNQEKPLAMLGAIAAKQNGFTPRISIYNNYTNATASLGPLGQWRAKKARLMVSGMKIINVFTRE